MASDKVAIMSPKHRGVIRVHEIWWEPEFLIPMAIYAKLLLVALGTKHDLGPRRSTVHFGKVARVRKFREWFQTYLLKAIMAVQALYPIIPRLVTFKTELHRR